MSYFLNSVMRVSEGDTFSEFYPLMNSEILNNNDIPWTESRDGKVKEMLDWKTTLTNPYRRLVGGYRRNINVFFLLAEAMWIASGRKDVRFLTIFNSRMSDFSDDGKVFHAPYGFRLRHWGQPSESISPVRLGLDQVTAVVRMLSNNPNTRQAVMSIWNPELDLDTKTKDMPCNDIVMFKVRDGKLVTTIANRSNDLHWGLPTNVFQFSFLTELMASAIGIKLGIQTHNSQSLHVYEWNTIAYVLNNLWSIKRGDETEERREALLENGFTSSEEIAGDLYDPETTGYEVMEVPMSFDFSTAFPVNRFREVSDNLDFIVDNLTAHYYSPSSINSTEEKERLEELAKFSPWLFACRLLLFSYIYYKTQSPLVKNGRAKDELRRATIDKIWAIGDMICGDRGKKWDVAVMAANFFARRITTEDLREELPRWLGNL